MISPLRLRTARYRFHTARYRGLAAIARGPTGAAVYAAPYYVTASARTSKEALAFALILGESLRRRSSRAQSIS